MGNRRDEQVTLEWEMEEADSTIIDWEYWQKTAAKTTAIGRKS